MANQKISQMPSLTASELAAGDLLAVVDVSDVTQASSGSNKKITLTDLQSAAISAGTANGVLYLNGSKVATSGSALTFDGSKFEVVSSATAAAVTRLKGGNVTNGGAAFYVQKSTDSSTVFAVGDSSAITGGSPDVEATIYTGTNIPLRFYVNAAERARIDSAGNLGLGITPSAWGTGYKAINIATGGAIYANTNSSAAINIGTNVKGANIFDLQYQITGQGATQYNQYNGVHSWSTAPSGTAGDAISFTQAMTLDASGSLLVGTTNNPTTGTFARPVLSFKQFNDSSFTSGWHLEAFADQSVLGVGYNGNSFQFGTSYRGTGAYKDISFAPSGTESMRITTSGNLGIGTTTPTAKLDVNSDIVRVRTAKTPASATAAGNAGDICWDSNYVYVCVATNTWKRSAISTW